jgi:hypothetical protein
VYLDLGLQRGGAKAGPSERAGPVRDRQFDRLARAMAISVRIARRVEGACRLDGDAVGRLAHSTPPFHVGAFWLNSRVNSLQLA